MIASNIYARMTGTSGGGSVDDYINLPIYTNIGLSEYYALSSIDLFQVKDFGFWTEDPAWQFQIYIEDLRRNTIYSSTASSGTHVDIGDIPSDIKDFRIYFKVYYSQPSAGDVLESESIYSVRYHIVDPGEVIDTLYFAGSMITNGLTPVRAQNIPTEGLAYNAYYTDSDFSIYPYVPEVYWRYDGTRDFLSYVEQVFKEKAGIVSQLKLFGSVYDNIVIDALKNYGVKCLFLKNDYIRYNILFNRGILDNIHFLWAHKGTVRGLQGALKLFANVHPFAPESQDTLGWMLSQTNGGISYGIDDTDVLLWASEDIISDDDKIVYLVDAGEVEATTDQSYGVKLNYFIDPWGVTQYFREYSDVDDIKNNYEFGTSLIASMVTVAEHFAPANAKVYYWWTNSLSERKEIYVL